MTGEQFLNSIRYLDNEINALRLECVRITDERQSILDLAETWGGLNGVCVQSGVSNKTERLGLALASLVTDEVVMEKTKAYLERVNKKCVELLTKKLEAFEVIEKIPDAKHRAVLTYRYIDNLKWESIADIMGYAQNWLEIRVKRQAIEAFEKAQNSM
jgi:hypothetical protein